MTMVPDPRDLDLVARHALRMVADGMTLGLGTGRAAEAFIHDGASLADIDRLDVAFDGADEVTPELALTKGLGGALLRERVVAFEAERFVVLVTPEKLVDRLATRTPIPVEVVPFANLLALRLLAELGARPVLRRRPEGGPFVTDNQNWILDTDFGPIAVAVALDAQVRKIPGVVDTGIFLDMASLVLVGDGGVVRELRPPRPV